MAKEPLKCICCGEVVPARMDFCPYCRYEVVDRDVWYIRYGHNIVGAMLWAVLSPTVMVICVPRVVPLPVWLWEFLCTYAWLWALLGGAMGFFVSDKLHLEIADVWRLGRRIVRPRYW